MMRVRSRWHHPCTSACRGARLRLCAQVSSSSRSRRSRGTTATRRSTSPPTASRCRTAPTARSSPATSMRPRRELTLDTPRLTVAYSDSPVAAPAATSRSTGSTRPAAWSCTARRKRRKGDFGIYDLDRKLITLIGNVQLNQRSNIRSTAQRLVIDLDSGRAVVDGGPPGVNSERRPGDRPLHGSASASSRQQTMNEAATFARPSAEAQRRIDGGLEVISIAKSYDKRNVLSDVSLTSPRRGGRPARAQRGGEDDLLRLDHGVVLPGRRPDPAGRRRRH